MHFFNSCSELLVYIELCFHTINNSYSHSLNDSHTLTKQRKKVQDSALPTDLGRQKKTVTVAFG